MTGTPSSHWGESDSEDPHGDRYDCERAQLALGHLTDDQLANAVFLDPNIVNLTAAKDRIRWLSRGLETALEATRVLESIRRYGELGCVSAGEPLATYGGKKPPTKDVFQFARHMLPEIDAAIESVKKRKPTP